MCHSWSISGLSFVLIAFLNTCANLDLRHTLPPFPLRVHHVHGEVLRQDEEVPHCVIELRFSYRNTAAAPCTQSCYTRNSRTARRTAAAPACTSAPCIYVTAPHRSDGSCSLHGKQSISVTSESVTEKSSSCTSMCAYPPSFVNKQVPFSLHFSSSFTFSGAISRDLRSICEINSTS